jgi:hypothetical protein
MEVVLNALRLSRPFLYRGRRGRVLGLRRSGKGHGMIALGIRRYFIEPLYVWTRPTVELNTDGN